MSKLKKESLEYVRKHEKEIIKYLLEKEKSDYKKEAIKSGFKELLDDDDLKKDCSPFDLMNVVIKNIIVIVPFSEKANDNKDARWIYLCYDKSKDEYKACYRGNLVHLMKKHNIPKPKNYMNMIGYRSGKLVVVSEAPQPENINNNEKYWWCKCDCGNSNLVRVSTNSLRRKARKSCGCEDTRVREHGIKNHKIGDIVNEWKIIKETTQNGKECWECECTCGCKEKRIINKRKMSATFCKSRIKQAKKEKEELRRTFTINKNIPHFLEDLTGKIYGKLTVLGFGKKILNKYYWICQCECGNKTIVEGSVLRKMKTISCGCVQSSGELYIIQFLKKYNIQYIYQFSFPDCKDKNPLKFDFLIYYKNSNKWFLCEFQGKQHYKPIKFSSNWTEEYTEKVFKNYTKRDNIKKEYCKKNNIELFEICYKDFKKIDEILAEKLGIELENTQ